MSLSVDFSARLDALVPQPGCVYDALQPILHTCETPDNIEDRTRLSVALSLCEFAAARVQGPPACENAETLVSPSALALCTAQLESRATWWTTFSGNYRHISLICNEFKPQFESQHLLRMYRDASALFEDHNDLVRTHAAELAQELSAERSNAQREWRTAWQAMSTELSLAKEALAVFQHELSSQLSTDRLTEFHEASSSMLNAMALASRGIEISSARAAQRSDELIAQLSIFEQNMSSISQTQFNAAQTLKSAVIEAEITLNRTGRALASYHALLKAVFGLFGLVSQFFLPLAAIMVFFLLYKRRTPASDISFY